MKKRFIIDTNVLLHDPEAIFNFKEHDVCLPIEVVIELDKFKKERGERGFSARQATRNLESLTGDNFNSNSVDLSGGGKLYFDIELPKKLPPRLEAIISGQDSPDTIILRRAYQLNQKQPNSPITLVTKDLNLRIRAKLAGVPTEDYLYDKAAINLHHFFEQKPVREVEPEFITSLYEADKNGLEVPPELVIAGERYFILNSGSAPGSSAIVKYCTDGRLRRLPENLNAGDIRPRNVSQKFLLDACLDSRIEIVSGLGKAGTGKTLVSLAAAIHQVIGPEKEKRYDKIVVVRPILESGSPLGYLPGTVDEKIGPYFAPVDTALKRIFQSDKKGTSVDIWHLEEQGLLEKKPITYIRGDTLYRSFVIVDEAQNFTPGEIKLIGTRLGEGSKIVMLGDPFQIDNPYLDEKSNGLTVAAYKFRGHANSAYVILDRGERSPIAEVFADLL